MFVSPLSNQSFHQGSLKFYNDPTPLAWRQTRGLRGSSWSGAPWAWRPSWRTSTPSSPWSGCANAATGIHHEKSNWPQRPINISLVGGERQIVCVFLLDTHIYLCLLPSVRHRWPEALVAHRPPHVVEPGVGVDHLEVRLRVVLDAALQRLSAPRQLPEDQAQTARENNISMTTCSNGICYLDCMRHATTFLPTMNRKRFHTNL